MPTPPPLSLSVPPPLSPSLSLSSLSLSLSLSLSVEGKLFFAQLPLLELDGMTMNQSQAIVRYIAEKGGLMPQDPKLRFRSVR